MLLYKYLSPARLDVLLNGKIRFSQGSILNDPYELRPNFEAFKERYARLQVNNKEPVRQMYKRLLRNYIIAPETRKAIRKLRKSDREKFRDFLVELIRLQTDRQLDDRFQKSFDASMLILSLSRTADNQLMWSHYAEGHKGYVIGFDSEILSDYLAMTYQASAPFEVMYSSKRYRFAPDDSPFQSTLLPISEDGIYYTKYSANIEFSFDQLSTKSKDWAYEQETRIFAPASGGEEEPGSPLLNCPILLYKFPPQSVRQVIIGSATGIERFVQFQELMQWKYPHAELCRASPDPETFAMRIEPLLLSHPTVKLGLALKKNGLISEFGLADKNGATIVAPG